MLTLIITITTTTRWNQRASQHGRQFLEPAIAFRHGSLHVPAVRLGQPEFAANLVLQIPARTRTALLLRQDQSRELSVQRSHALLQLEFVKGRYFLGRAAGEAVTVSLARP